MQRRGCSTIVVFLAAILCATSSRAEAQDPNQLRHQINASQTRLDQIRAERQRLQQELNDLTGQVTNVSEEISNIEKQISASTSLLAELNIQLGTLSDQVTVMTRDMLNTRDALAVRTVTLHQRLREIYKRGPLRPIQVLFSSRSFSDLLNRYKYLHDVALFDRMLVREVHDLERKLTDQRATLSTDAQTIGRVQLEKLNEFDELERLETQRQRRLAVFTGRQSEAHSTLAHLATEEQQLRALLEELEEKRRRNEREIGVATISNLTTSDLGNLDWPLDGDILYQFGPQHEGNTTIPREGLGIRAERGSPVHAVDAGTVGSVVARSSGQTVILDHGGGFYSSYQRLRNVTVTQSQRVEQGQIIGHVGGDSTNPHIEFQIYEPSSAGPRAVDPVRWLRNRTRANDHNE
jgi:septal ring factor EnvC (AmiA/AmiB activator)